MSAEVCFHATKRLTAKAVHQPNLHFVELTFTDVMGQSSHATVFFRDGERAANLYAAGINEVDKALHPVASIADVLRRSEEREPV